MFSKILAPRTKTFVGRVNRHLGLLQKTPEAAAMIKPKQTQVPKFNFVKKHNRNLKYSHITDEDVTFFSKMLGESSVITDEAEISPFNIDFTKKYHGNCQLVLTPTSTEQVAEVLKYCNEKNLAVVPQGGNTGLVGGSVPLYDEIVISTKKMNKVLDFDPLNGVLVCEAGCVLEYL